MTAATDTRKSHLVQAIGYQAIKAEHFVLYRSIFDLALPLDGLLEEFDHLGGLGLLGRFAAADAIRDGPHHLVGGHLARQAADIPVLGGPIGPEGDFDHLLAVGATV